MGKPMKRTVNRDLVLQCKQALKRRGLEYIPVKGRYGGDENSLFVINPLLKDMMELSRQFDQESFIFATCADGGCDMGYYEKGQGDSPYIVKFRSSLNKSGKIFLSSNGLKPVGFLRGLL